MSKGYEVYHHTKGRVGERLILSYEGQDGMQTVILRPCGMTGWVPFLFSRQYISSNANPVNATSNSSGVWQKSKEKKQHHVQIGNNANLVDYAYVGNIAHAHVLACAKLVSQPELVSGQTFFITNGEPLPQ